MIQARRATVLLVVALLLGGGAGGVRGGEVLPAPGEPVRQRLDAGAPPAARFRLTDTLSYGGRLEFKLVDEQNYNLGGPNPSRGTVWQPLSASLALLWRPRRWLSVYGNLELDTYVVLEQRELTIDGAPRLQVDKLWADLVDAQRHLRLRVGRHRVKDKREWLIDDTLDGATLFWNLRGHRLRLGAWRERAFTENLLDRDPPKERDQVWLHYESRGERDFHYALYFFGQTYPKRDERAVWFGGHVRGEWEDLDYWLDAAAVTGSRRGRRLGGIGFDVGGVLRVHKRPRVYLIGSLAYGSGDRDDVDLGFRQTGLQDNSTKLGGVTRMVYYGEVLDPELSNLWIFTAGVGTRPVRDVSVNLVYHYYLQDQPLDELRDSDLDVEPEGDSRDIGHELDLVIGYRHQRRFRLEVVLGRFFPGRAFPAGSGPADLIKVEARYNF